MVARPVGDFGATDITYQVSEYPRDFISFKAY